MEENVNRIQRNFSELCSHLYDRQLTTADIQMLNWTISVVNSVNII